MALPEENPGRIALSSGKINEDTEEKKVSDREEAKLRWYEYLVIYVVEVFLCLTIGAGIALITIYGIFSGMNSQNIGLGIILLLPFAYAIYMKMIIVMVPEKKRYLLLAFKRYYKSLGPGLHLIVPYIMEVGRELTLAATKMFDIYMKTDSARLEFKGGTIGVNIKLICRAYDSYELGFGIYITDEEIAAIEKTERDMGFDKLPENWMYFAAIKAEAAIRGVCGRYTIDEAIEARSVGKQEVGEFRAGIISKALDECNKSVEKYGIIFEQVAFSSIELPKKLEEARNKIQIAVETKKEKDKLLEVAIVDAKIGEQEGLKTRNRLDAIASDEEIKEEYTDHADGNKKKSRVVGKKSSGLSRADVMKWEASMEVAKSVDNISVLSGGKDESIPLEIAARMGAAFRTGSDSAARKEKQKPEKKEKKEEGSEEEGEDSEQEKEETDTKAVEKKENKEKNKRNGYKKKNKAKKEEEVSETDKNVIETEKKQ
ncbi:MAG: SPFH domain-containing protein [Candidatus Paceibacterota bacterium]|jgi:hypothetical protein